MEPTRSTDPLPPWPRSADVLDLLLPLVFAGHVMSEIDGYPTIPTTQLATIAPWEFCGQSSNNNDKNTTSDLIHFIPKWWTSCGFFAMGSRVFFVGLLLMDKPTRIDFFLDKLASGGWSFKTVVLLVDDLQSSAGSYR